MSRLWLFCNSCKGKRSCCCNIFMLLKLVVKMLYELINKRLFFLSVYFGSHLGNSDSNEVHKLSPFICF